MIVKAIGQAVDQLVWNCSDLFKKKKALEVDTTNLPSIVNQLTGQCSSPANCWNATMLYHGFQEVRYTPPEEIAEWMHYNTVRDEFKLCTPGTIMVFTRGSELIHTAVFVAPNKLWHKRGVHGMWEFVSLEDVRMIYSGCSHEFRILK